MTARKRRIVFFPLFLVVAAAAGAHFLVVSRVANYKRDGEREKERVGERKSEREKRER
jgi:hypothetical protein